MLTRGVIAMMQLKNNFTLVSGVSKGENYELISFDSALIAAGISDYNLVRISSILPPNSCFHEYVDCNKGAILHTAYASLTQKGAGIISSAIAVGIPKETDAIGVIMEHSCFSEKNISIATARKMVEIAMNRRGIKIENILSIGCETELSMNYFSTTFAAIPIW